MMASFSTPPALQGRRRWEWLVASIAINLVLIGLILSYLLGGHRHQPFVTWQSELLPTLGADDARIVQSAIDRIAAEQMSGDSRIHEDFTRTRAILAVEPLDRDALAKAMNDIAAARNAQQTEIGDIFRDELQSLSADGRAKILAAMERESRRYHPPPGH